MSDNGNVKKVFEARIENNQIKICIDIYHIPTLLTALKCLDLQIEKILCDAQSKQEEKAIIVPSNGIIDKLRS